MSNALISTPVVMQAATLLERLLDGGRRHRQEMARIRLEETRVREEYRLMNRQLDAALEVALRKLEIRERAEQRQFDLIVRTLARQAGDAETLREVMRQASLAAFSSDQPMDIRQAAQGMLPALLAQMEQMQSHGVELVRVARRREEVLASDLSVLGRLSGPRDG